MTSQETKMALKNNEPHKKRKQSLDMLKLVAMGKKQIDEGQTKPAAEVFESIEKKLGL